MTDRGHMRMRQLINADRLPQSLEFYLSTVLEFATRGLSSNVAVFLDADASVQPPCDESGKPDGLTRSDLAQEPWSRTWDEAVMSLVSRCGPFPVLIWISQRVLKGESPSVFQTAVLAHECGHARQTEQVPDLWKAWVVYSDFLATAHHMIPRWYAPLEIDAELFGRRVTRLFHPHGELVAFQTRYENYDRVLGFECSRKFDLKDYFTEFMSNDGPSGFGSWLERFLSRPEGRPYRENVFLRGCMKELDSGM